MAELKAFLRAVARKPFVWGHGDCILTGADWVREVEGWDPAAEYRGAYETELEAEGLLILSGGLVGMIQAQLRRSQIESPQAGDIGVVVVRGLSGRTEVTAICTGRRWAAKTPRGVWIGTAEVVAAWRIECPLR